MAAKEIFEHEGKFIIVTHHTGQNAGLATPVVTKGWAQGHGFPGMMPHATAYEVARRFASRAQAEGWLRMQD